MSLKTDHLDRVQGYTSSFDELARACGLRWFIDLTRALTQVCLSNAGATLYSSAALDGLPRRGKEITSLQPFADQYCI